MDERPVYTAEAKFAFLFKILPSSSTFSILRSRNSQVAWWSSELLSWSM